MSAAGRDPAAYIRGSEVVVPAPLAGPLFALLVPALRDRVRSSALPITDELAGFLEALHAVDVASERAVSVSGHARAEVGSVAGMSSAAEAADAVGLSARQVRRLCARGLVASQRVGTRAYLVDVGSLRAYLRGEVAA
ncbi:hypothetical protein [Georgenia sp. AZ-5]|uniref:hypothetical protein n=1 Tax=Georgenia sp. AZ-5 TaxID=3367526 RepID=UPI0037545C56